MKPNESIAFPVETFISAGIPRNSSVKILVSGKLYSYGPIAIEDLKEIVPDQCGFRDIAGGCETWEVTTVTVEVGSPPPGSTRSFEFKFPGGNTENRILTLSSLSPVAAHKVAFIDAEITETTVLTVADLAFVTYREGLLWIHESPLTWNETGWFDSKFIDYWVVDRGERHHPSEWHWAARPLSDLCEGLLEMQTHVHVTHDVISRKDAARVLREEPNRWAMVVEAFIARFGPLHARNLLGGDNVAAVLNFSFRGIATAARKAGGLESPPQLFMGWAH